jgi:DNA-binding MarR family transcriptional regulator
MAMAVSFVVAVSPIVGRSSWHGQLPATRSNSLPRVTRAADLREIERALQMLVRLNASRRVHTERSAAAGVLISQPGYALLSRIDEQGPLRLSELGKLIHMDPATVGRQVRQLEETGLVASSQDERDARVTLVRVTPKGRQAHERILRITQTHLASVLDTWNATDRAQLAALLSRLIDDFRQTRFRDTLDREVSA